MSHYPERCYGDGEIVSNQPNQLDSQNPITIRPYEPIPLSTQGSNVQDPNTPPLPGDRCYSPLPPPLKPNALDSPNPVRPIPYTPPEQEEELDPRSVVRALVDRCYPPSAPLSVEPEDIPTVPNANLDPQALNFICDFFPDLPFCKDCGPTSGYDCFPFPWKISFPFPVPAPPTIGAGDDCAEVEQLKTEGQVEELGNGNWRHTVTGEILYCPDRHTPNTDWERCVKNTLDCLFEPYKDGAWKPPAQDCLTFYPQGYNGNVTEICIANCFPERVAIYEYKKGGSVTMLSFQPDGDGINDSMQCTTNADGSWDGSKLESVGGNRIWNNGSQRTQTFSFGGASVTIVADPYDDDGEWDTDWWAYFTGTLPSVGTEQDFTFNGDKKNVTITLMVTEGSGAGSDHSYGTSASAPAGYVMTSSDPAFYLHKKATPGSVPVYKFYSSEWQDTFLTTNPGQPDGPGQGERETMNRGGMGFIEILGYAYDDSVKMIPYLETGEKANPLHRYWRGSSGTDNNHKYSIDAQVFQEPPTKASKKNYYHIPTDIHDALQIKAVLERGGAGYQNAMGVYIAEPKGDPVWGAIIEPRATTSTGMKKFRISASILNQYKRHELGFFLIPNGGNQNSLSTGQVISFSALSDGWRASGISSAQSNYVFFSDHRLNPKDSSRGGSRQFSKWVGNNFQYWEDLIGGDNDFDDMKFWHELNWHGQTYKYEGIQCYVWRDPAPTPIKVPIRNKSECDQRLFDRQFQDIQVTRSDCGPEVFSVDPDATEMKIECGKCNGSYTFEMNRSQTIDAISSGKFSIRSMGGVVGGIAGDCITARFRLTISGSVVWDQQIVMEEWPEIGSKMHPGIADFSVSKGDTITLEVVSITQGPFAGSVSPKMSIFDEATQLFEGAMTVRLMTTAGDSDSYPIPYQLGNKDALPTDGQVRGMDMQLAVLTGEDGKNGGDIVWNLADMYKMYENGALVDTDNEYAAKLTWSQRMNGMNRGWNYTTGSRYGAYLDSFGINSGDVRQHFNKLTTSDLFKDGKTGRHKVDPNLAGSNTKNHIETPYNYARLARFSDNATVWWDESATRYGNYATNSEILDDLYDGISQNNTFEFYEPGYFIQDYYLVDDDAKDKIDYTRTAKIRMGITFYPYSTGASLTTFGKAYRRSNFYAIVELLEVLNNGYGYSEGQEFDLKWPIDYEKKQRKWADQGTPSQVVDDIFSPFHPKHHKPNTYGVNTTYKIPQEVGISYEYQDKYQDTGKSPVRDALYQESHNKQSMIWYLRRTDPKNHIHFKVRVSDVS